MARGKASKKESLSIEERLEQALVPNWEQPYKVPENWVWSYLTTIAECLDKHRKPVNSEERATRTGEVPYYGATGQVGWIDDFLTSEELVLVGEDGAPFLDYVKDKAYMIAGKAWVNNHAHILKSYFGTCGNKFIMHYLNCFNYKGYVNGTTRLKLTQASMNVLPIPLPPLTEQQRIVDRIESLFAKLDKAKEKAQAALDSFENRKAAILHKAFTGELTKKWRKRNDLSMGSWKQTLSDNVFSYITSGSRGWAQYYSNSGAIFIRMGNLNHGTIKVDFSNVQYVSLPNKTEGQRSLVQKNDILVSITADVGMVGIIEEDNLEAYINQHVALARPLGAVNPQFVAWFLVSDLGLAQLRKLERGATKKGLSLKNMKSLQITLPQIEEQFEIVHILDSLFKKEQKAKELAGVIGKIDLMKKAILARAFRGELGTNDPEEESAMGLLRKLLENKS